MTHVHQTFALIVSLLAVSLLAPSFGNGQDLQAAREANRAGLAAHRAGRFGEARGLFEQALEHAATHHVARFNAACAAAKMGDLAAAETHANQYLAAAPDQAQRLLFDPDLEMLRAQEAWLARLRQQIRPEGAEVREIVFERRDLGELFAVGSDGLDLRQLTDTPGKRAYDASFAAGGRQLVFRARVIGEDYSSEANYVLPLFWQRNRYREDLQVMTYPEGTPRIVATYVRHHQLLPDGETLVYLARPDGQPTTLYRVPVSGGAPGRIAEMPGVGTNWCVQQESDGAWLVARTDWQGWGGTFLEVTRIRGDNRSELLSRGSRRRPLFYGISHCALTDEGLDLGGGVLHLGAEPRFESFGAASGAPGTYRTRVTSRHSSDSLVPARWRIDPLSYGYDGGMADYETWHRTAIFRAGSDRALRRTSPERTYIEYAASLDPNGERLLLTRLRGRTAMPWLVLRAPDGSGDKLVSPGQFGVWSPFVHRVARAGAPIRHGSP